MELEGVSLVLEGGGMRGLFTAGVLDVFLEQNLMFQHVIGVSAGACHACSYLSRQKGRALAISVDYLHDKHYMGLYSLLTSGDLFNVRYAYERIPLQLNPYDYDAFLQAAPDFCAVVTNCRTGQAEYPTLTDLRKDLVWVRASASLPYVSRLVRIGGQPYLDGGLCDSIPLEHMRQRGFAKNVVVLTRHAGYRKSASSGESMAALRYALRPGLVAALRRRPAMYNAQLDYVRQQEAEGHAFVLRPPEPLAIERIEKDRSKLLAAYEAGRQETLRRLPDLLAYLQADPSK